MAVSTSTPPYQSDRPKTMIFPFKENRHLVDAVAIEFGIVVYPEKNLICYTGYNADSVAAKLVGGSTGNS